MVDTQLCGIFFKINSQASVQFLPSPEYLEAGKFKISRHAKMVDTQNLNLNKLYYRESYDQLLAVSDYYTLFDRPSECLGYKKSDLALVSSASISTVTNVSKDKVARILTDFFQGLIEVSRRTNKEAKICVGACGHLLLQKNRELSF